MTDDESATIARLLECAEELLDRESNPQKYTVALTILGTGNTHIRVSTVILTSVFLGIDAPPDRLVYETKMFIDGRDVATVWTDARAEAVKVHGATVGAGVWSLAVSLGEAVKAMEHWPQELEGAKQ